MNSIHQCVVKDCSNPPTKMIEAEVGLEGALTLYFCDEHGTAFQRGDLQEFEADRTEPEGAEVAES